MRSNNLHTRKRTYLYSTVASLAIAGAVALGTLGSIVAPVQADPVKVEQKIAVPGFADVVEQVSPAVVSVRVASKVEQADVAQGPSFDMPGFNNLPKDHPLRRFFDQFGNNNQPQDRQARPQQRQRGAERARPVAQGSGFFISDDGYVVTNNHVVEGGSEFTLVMNDGTELQAELVGTDPRTDLAVLKAKSDKKFTYVGFADDSKMHVGDWVVAVGNPFGLGGTVTAGIISARGRDIGANFYDDFIQIDAAVNRGNSGGPTFNLSGEVVGVNTAIFSPSGGNVGIAFAIPAATAQKVVAELVSGGSVVRGWLGVQIRDVTKEIAESLGLKDTKGALIVDVNANEPAEKSGVKPGDIITEVGGQAIGSSKDLARSIAGYKPGESVDVKAWRDNKEVTLKVELGTMPNTSVANDATAPSQGAEAATTDFGLSVTKAEDGTGLLVTDVKPGSDAEEAGILAGDIVRAINSQPVTSADDVTSAVQAAKNAGRARVFVQITRDGKNNFLTLPITQ